MEELGKDDNLERRGATYRCRMRCPKHLLRDGVPVEKSISLGTKDRNVARGLLPAARQELLEFFQRGSVDPRGLVSGIIRSVGSNRRPDHPDLPFLTVSEAEVIAKTYFRRAFAELDLSSAGDAELSIEKREQREAELEDLVARLHYFDARTDDPAMDVEISLLRRAGRRAPVQSSPSRLLRGYVRRALTQIWRIELERLRGNYTDKITDSFFMEANPELLSSPPQPALKDGQTLGEALGRYEAELLKKGRNEKTQDRYKAELAHIAAFFGRNLRMSDLKRADCTAFRDAFAALPPNFAKRKSVDLHEIISSRKPDDAVLAHATLAKYLDALSRFTRWADKEDLIEKDYGEGLEPIAAKPDGSMAKLPFEIADLERFFARPIYTGCVNDERGFSTAGTNIVRRARYWAPLISLFGGLRSGEIFQLTPSHFRLSEAGVPFIVLTKDMKLKNDNAEREIPVHPVLSAIGLLTWVERRSSTPSALLFPEITPDKYGSVSSAFGKRFKSDLERMEFGERRAKLTFHSFRHTFKRALDREEISEQEKDELCGWARAKKTGRRYGVGLEADRLRRSLQLVSYDLDLGHLRSHAILRD